MIKNMTFSPIITKTGLDVSVKFTCTETNLEYFKIFSFVSQRELDHDLNNRITKASDRITERFADEKIKKEWSREELETLLKEKGYLAENKKVEDLSYKIMEIK